MLAPRYVFKRDYLSRARYRICEDKNTDADGTVEISDARNYLPRASWRNLSRRLLTYSTLRKVSRREQFRVCHSGEILSRALLSLVTRTTWIAFRAIAAWKQTTSPQQEIKLGRMPEISIINYDCLVRTEETILLIKTMDTIASAKKVWVDFTISSDIRESSKYNRRNKQSCARDCENIR